MLVEKFIDNCRQYENFEVWDVASMDAFFKGNAALAEIFKIEYQIPVEEFQARRSEVAQTDMQIMQQLLNLVGDKYFFIFTFHDDHHWELVQLHENNIMNFGLDIGAIQADHVYILIMDKKPGLESLPN